MAHERGSTVPFRTLLPGLLGLALIVAAFCVAPAVRPWRGAHPHRPVRVANTSSAAGSGIFTPLPGARLLDTRRGPGALRSGEVRLLTVAGRGGVPADGVESVVLTITATAPGATGYVCVYPGGARDPGTSTVNFVSGQTVSNTTIVSLSDAGQVSLRAAGGPVQLVVDVTGWFSAGDTAVVGGFVPVGAARLIDTRRTGTPLRGTSPLSIAVTGDHEVPAGASAAVVNITGISTASSAALTAWPSGQDKPTASVLNLVPNSVAADLAVVKLGGTGALSIGATGGLTNVVVDLVGYINGDTDTVVAPGGTTPVQPYRLLDTRVAGAGRPVPAGATVAVRPADSGTVPSAGVAAVVLTVTTASSTVSGGYITGWASGTARPGSSNLNPRVDRPVAITVVVPVGADGRVNLYNALGSTHLIVDVTAYILAT